MMFAFLLAVAETALRLLPLAAISVAATTPIDPQLEDISWSTPWSMSESDGQGETVRSIDFGPSA